MKTIIFDFDGVLINSFPSVYLLIRDAMASVGVSLSESQYRNFFRENIQTAFRKFIPHSEDYEKFKEFRLAHYLEYYRKADLFPGAADLIRALAQTHTLTIASAAQDEAIFSALERYGIRDLFRLICTTQGRDKNELISEILHALDVSPGECVMVTDTSGDVAAAQKCGLPTIGVTWGFHSPEILQTANPTRLVTNFEELQKCLL